VHEPASFVFCWVIPAARRGSSDSHQLYGARLSCHLMRFGVTVGLLVMRQPFRQATGANAP